MKTDKDNLIAAGIVIALGWFFAGIICGIASLVILDKVKESSATKTALTCVGILEIVICFIALIR